MPLCKEKLSSLEKGKRKNRLCKEKLSSLEKGKRKNREEEEPELGDLRE
jgi:hypothetical protein